MTLVLMHGRKLLTCLQCDWQWLSSLQDRPSTCPHCKSGKWDQPKREKKEGEMETQLDVILGNELRDKKCIICETNPCSCEGL